jgi:hypothetical protein
MGSGKPIEDKVLSSAAAVLGINDNAALANLDRKSMSAYTQKQLFECAKRLQLKGVSKLSKDELAVRVASEFAARLASPAEDVATKKSSNALAEGDMPDAAEKAASTAGDGADSMWSHKFEVREHGTAEAPTTIPWSYDYDRVTGMAVDPDHLFVYWEVTDDAIERAREDLGDAGKTAWLNLRVYDTTDRIFDGTNAHSYFDHRVDRSDRHWFFLIGKPSSSAFVDIGLKSNQGYFVKIVRSGRVEFSRREPSAWGEPEWLSVRSLMGPIEHAGRGPHVRRQSPGIPQSATVAPAGVPGDGQRRHVALLPWEDSFIIGEGARTEVVEWEEHMIDGTTEFHSQSAWESPVMVSAWEAGPFSFSVPAPEPVREDFVGPSRVYRIGGYTHVVHGPWQVVIKGIGAHHGRAIIAHWEIYRSWIAEEKTDIFGAELKEYVIPGSSEKLLVGASERRWRYASEMRLGGASEVFFLGASEYRALGASERFFMGASQYKMRGASERQYLGGSEVRMRGASERMLAGASELRLVGASERRLGGGSEARLGGGSEGRLGGGSEGRLGGGSEGRLADDLAVGAPSVSLVSEASHYPSPESIGREPEHKE